MNELDPRIPSKHRLLLWGGTLLLIAVVSTYYYTPHLHRLTLPIHSWAQADRLSLAYNFYEHGLNPFRARTHHLGSEDRLVAVEFPLQAWLAANGAKLVGNKSAIPFLMRFIGLLAVALGACSLADFIFRRTASPTASLLPVAFTFASPLLVYYGFSYLSDGFGFGLALVGSVFTARFLVGEEKKLAFWGLGFLGLAALSKLSIALYLPGFVLSCIAAFWLRNERRIAWAYAAAAAAVATVLAGLFVNIKAQLARFDSWIFTTELHPYDESLAQIPDFYNYRFTLWQHDFLPQPLWTVAGILGILALWGGIRHFRARWEIWAMAVNVIGIGGGLLYLSGAQLLVHDYYWLIPLYAVLLFVVTSGAVVLGNYLRRLPGIVRWGVFAVLLVAAGFIFNMTESRHRYRWESVREWNNPEAWLDSADFNPIQNILSRSDTLQIEAGPAPNLGLVYVDRYGYNLEIDPETHDYLRRLSEFWNRAPYTLLTESTARALDREFPAWGNAAQVLVSTPRYRLYHSRKPLQLPAWQLTRSPDTLYATFGHTEPLYREGAYSYDLTVSFERSPSDPQFVRVQAEVRTDSTQEFDLLGIIGEPQSRGTAHRCTATFEAESLSSEWREISFGCELPENFEGNSLRVLFHRRDKNAGNIFVRNVRVKLWNRR